MDDVREQVSVRANYWDSRKEVPWHEVEPLKDRGPGKRFPGGSRHVRQVE
jgi:hypothetical protein